MPVRVPKSDLWRAIRAMCFECRGGMTRLDCRGRVCPFYFVLKAAKLDPILWWKHPYTLWEAMSQAAHRQMMEEATQKKKVRIKVKKRRRKKRKVKLVI